MKVNKKLLIIISAIILLVLYFTLGISNEKITVEKPDKILPIKILVMDKNKTNENITFDDANNGDIDEILYFAMAEAALYKKGNNYEGELLNINDEVFENITDYVFAKNNDLGEDIQDAEFIKKDKKVIIPVSYFEKSKMDDPIQLGVLSRLTEKQMKNTKIKVTISSFGKKKKIIKSNNFEMQTAISIANGASKSIAKKDINVYLNGKKIKLSENAYDWDSEHSIVTLSSLPVTLNDIYVTVNKKNIFSRFLNIKIASAVSFSNMKSYQTINGEPDVSVGQVIPVSLESKELAYVDLTTTNTKNCNFSSDYGNVKWTKQNACTSSWKYMYGWSGSYPSSYWNKDSGTGSVYNYATDKGAYNFAVNTVYTTFLVDLSSTSIGGVSLRSSTKSTTVYDEESDGNGGTIKVYRYNPTWISLICVHPGADGAAAVPSMDGGNLQVKVLSKTSNYIVLGFKTIATQGNQNGFGIYKFAYSDKQCTAIDVKKKFSGTASTPSLAGLKFHMFDNQFICNNLNSLSFQACINNETCAETYIDTAVTDASGYAIFKGLGLDPDSNVSNTYYIREDWGNGGSNYNVEKLCHAVTAPKSRKYNCHDEAIGILHDQGVEADTVFTNKQKKYCLTYTKKEGASDKTLTGGTFTFKLTGANGATYEQSTTTGSVTFWDLDKQNYSLVETNADGVVASNGTETRRYYNNVSAYTTADELTEMATMTDGTPTKTGTTCKNLNVGDSPYKYCIKIKKVDATTGEVPKDGDGNNLTADFTITGELGAAAGNTTVTTDSNTGISTFYLGEINPLSKSYTYTIKETRTPEGYGTAPDKSVTINSTNDTAYAVAKDGKCSIPDAQAVVFEDSPVILNWYKVTENGSTRLPGAKFKVNNGAIKSNGKATTGPFAGCYKYSANGTISEFEADSNGSVCIMGISTGNYTVTETKSGEYHTFGLDNNGNPIKDKVISTSTAIVAMNDNNKFINQPTYVKFHKTVSNTNYAGDGVNNEFKDITTAELQKIDFNVYDSSNNLLSFKYNSSEGVYEYAKDNTLDLPSVSGSTTDLHLNNDRNIIIKHLAKGTYRIVEKETKVCGNTSSNNENCIGYYTPNNASTFTVTDNSTKNGNVYATNVEMTNTPTEIEFTKADFYGYEDASDVVDFENDKERNDFDKIVFKIKDENGNYLNLRYMGKEGTCLTDNSYSIYRYVPSDNTNVSNNQSTGTELHTCGGHIRITNLCKGKRYIVEEISVPEDSVFVKEQQNGQNPQASYTIPCKEGEVTRETTTNIINDKPTRIRLEKRDLKYGNLINDETTTFEIYRCPKGETCNPSDYATVEERESAGMKLVKFAPRAYLRGDEEDGGPDDFERSYQVYKAMSDSDVQNGVTYKTSLHPDKGVLILRYLQAGYNYVAYETKAPVGYNLPSGKLAETNFTVINTTVDVEAIKVPNRPSKIIVRKYDTEGKLLTGARFKIYKVNKEDYNENIAVSLQKKTELPLKTIRAGVYEYREIYDTNEFTTCVDTEASKCSSITGTLTDESFATSNLKETIEVKQGEAIVQYLDVDNYYIIEEVKAPDGHELPKNKEDRFKMVYLPESVEKVDAFTELVNTETTFTFYKFDEYNNLLDGAEFKLQKLNNNKKYEDVTVTETTISDKKVYKVDKDSTNTVITTTEGAATVAYMTKGQYRIVETKAAPGKELPKKTLNVATFFVDDDGSVHGSAIITNKSKTEMIESKPKASAELIVNIQTGQIVIKYALIIVVLLLVGAGLFIIKRKIDKK